jgi:hypothetical protein
MMAFQLFEKSAMHPVLISCLIIFCTVGGAVIGLWLRRVLPDYHLDDKSKDVVRVSVGLVVTMVSLVLSLGVSTAKTSFSAAETALRQSASQITQLNLYLQQYGPETEGIRQVLYQQVAESARPLWPELEPLLKYDKDLHVEPTTIAQQVLALKPQTDYQAWLKAQALTIVSAQLQQGALLVVPTADTAKTPMVIMLCIWLVMIFISFGLFAPSHFTGKLAIVSCAISVSAAVYFVLELEHPYGGWIRVSSEPLLHALAQINP